ncbi:hypothetical protein U14_03330 [Candidatus Moduliflexus flocculans]|uniref:Uncharacterized protein n=1 Tax=Candidatus Moduliflexus flocculans TaxID=1499966 RepID=A0A081BNW7_9BACT|nr:hypothetical protein U14_03330 [Candidatus Moduliflexus flocculans]
MLDISLYSKMGKPPITIDVSENFYAWLIQSDFAEIGVTRPQTIMIDGEEQAVDVIDLTKGKISNRQRLREFLIEVMAQEVHEMFKRLGETPTKKEYQEATYNLKKLQQLKLSIEDEAYQFLQKAS